MDKLLDIIVNFYGPTPYLSILGALLLCGLGIPIPEDLILIFAGLLSYYGLTNLPIMLGVAFLGVLGGDTMIFFLGAHYGRRLTKRWFFHRLLPDDRLNAVKVRFHKRGNKLIFAARFMPGLRAPIFFSAGTLHLPARVFVFYDGMAALLSVPTIIGLVYYFGDELDVVVRWIRRVEHGILFLILLIVAAALWKWYYTHRKLKKSEINPPSSKP